MASILNVDQINNAAGTSALTIGSSGNVNIPGHVVQVVQDIETADGSQSLAVGDFSTAILSASITPASASSKILVLCNLNLATSTTTAGAAGLLKRDGTPIGVGDADSGSAQATGGGIGSNVSTRLISNIAMTVLDTPSTTSAITYTAHGKHGLNGTAVVYWNREQATPANGANARVSSTLILMEIAG